MTSASVAPQAVSLVSPPVAAPSTPGRRTVTDMASLPEWCAEIALAPVGDQDDDTPGFFAGDRDRRGDRGTSRDAAEDAFLARETLRHRDRLVGPHDAMLVGGAFVPERRADGRRQVLQPSIPWSASSGWTATMRTRFGRSAA